MNISKDFSTLFSSSFFYAFKKEENLSLELQELYSRIIYNEKVNSFHINRKNEFLLGRLCASKAYELCTGAELLSLPSGDDRAPIWPSNVVGSISHDKNWAGAAVAKSDALLGVGIDFEELGRTHLKLSSQIRSEKDLKSHPVFTEEELLTLIFSAKESLFKALYPLVKNFFYFSDASLMNLDTTNGIFEIELLTKISEEYGPGKHSHFIGRYLIFENTCLTVIEIPRHY